MKIMINIFILYCFMMAPVQAVNEIYIDELEKNVDNLYETVDRLSHIIVSSELRGALDILSDYHTQKAKLIYQWFVIASQRDNKPSITEFINNTKFLINSYLGQLQFDNEEPISSEDYRVIKKEMAFLVNNSSMSLSKHFLNYDYFAKVDVHVRSLPIVSELTKQQEDNNTLILKKRDFFKLFYSIKYITVENKVSHWGYIEIERNKIRGWVNLKHAYKVN